MLTRIFEFLEFLFGCHHRNLSFPIKPRRRLSRAQNVTGTYVVCLDCGRELPYDWDEMRVLQTSGKRLRSIVPLMNIDD